MSTGLKSTTKKSLSDEEIMEHEAVTVQSDPMFLIDGGFLWIKTKEGEMARLEINKAQAEVFDIIRKRLEENKPIRLWVLKARQEGISTISEAIIYALASQSENINALIMADEDDKSDYLFEISKLYQEKMEEHEPHLAPNLKKSNAKVLNFDKIHSQIFIETANNIKATRAYTYQYVHLSETAYFRDLEAVMRGLSASVPKSSRSIIIGETTANGMNEFYEEWRRAIEGKTDWIPVFIPWFWMDEYRKSLEDGSMYPIDGIDFSTDFSRRQFLEEEKHIKEEYGLDDEQLNWRRWTIVNDQNGDINSFRQEYPICWEEAFEMSGEMFFDRNGLKKQIAKDPKYVGEIAQEQFNWKFREMPHGRIKIYETPMRDEEYLVVCDAAEGIPGRDEAAIIVRNKRLNQNSALVAGPYTPEEIAGMAIALGHFYNNSMIIPENKGYGYMVAQLIYEHYGNIYRRVVDKKGKKEKREELGFNTNSTTRPAFLGLLNEEIRKNVIVLVFKEVLDECQTFIVNPDTKKPQAQEGKQDGLVICNAIASYVRQQYPYTGKALDRSGGSAFEPEERQNYGFGKRIKGRR